MQARFDIRRVSLTMAIIMAMVLVAIPVCQIVTCGMTQSSMSGMLGSGASLSSQCEFSSMNVTSPSGVVPPGAETLILALGLLIAAVIAGLFPALTSRALIPVAVLPLDSPPDPLGARLRL